MSSASQTIAPASERDLPELLSLMRAYCEFYATSPSDEALLALSQSLIDDPLLEGLQLIARDQNHRAVGFATVFWSWDTTAGTRIGIMNDLFVAPEARGSGVAERLIEACLQRCAGRGASRLEWQTAPDNLRAQAVYERVGGKRGPWVPYSKPVPGDGV
jgi:GNAT superfamily N-acetyltransferase